MTGGKKGVNDKKTGGEGWRGEGLSYAKWAGGLQIEQHSRLREVLIMDRGLRGREATETDISVDTSRKKNERQEGRIQEMVQKEGRNGTWSERQDG